MTIKETIIRYARRHPAATNREICAHVLKKFLKACSTWRTVACILSRHVYPEKYVATSLFHVSQQHAIKRGIKFNLTKRWFKTEDVRELESRLIMIR